MQAEVDISKFWPTRRVSSCGLNSSSGRLHHNPSRLDKLLLDVQKEHAKVNDYMTYRRKKTAQDVVIIIEEVSYVINDVNVCSFVVKISFLLFNTIIFIHNVDTTYACSYVAPCF